MKKNNLQETTSENQETISGTSQIIKKIKSNYWIVSTFVLAIILVIIILGRGGGLTGNVILSGDEIGQKVVDFANSQGANAELVSTGIEGDLYEVVLSIEGQEFPVYATRDGKNIITGMIPLETEVQTPTTETQTQASAPKSDRPLVELFIMTHCPYGTQAEKGFIPFMEAIGNKVDAKIRFVHYFMHEPEYNETPIQVCIREEQQEKFIPYLREFLKEGNTQNALKKANIDEGKMNKCVSSGKWEEYYNEDKELSQSYGVGGSPTLVVNGVITQSGRSPSAYLATACSAFNNAPEECNQKLSTATPAPMWGWDASSGSTSAQC